MKPDASSADPFRSLCPLASALDLVGDKWTLLILRDLFIGKQRFSEFLASPEGISPRLLSQRLSFLEEHGLVAKIVTDGAHPRYALTAQSLDLKEVALQLAEWGQRHIPGRRSPYLARARADSNNKTP